MIPIFLETNKNEAEEFIETYFNIKLIFLLAYYLIGVLMFLEIKKQVFLTGLISGVIVIFIGVTFFNIPNVDITLKNNFYPRMLLNYHIFKKNIEETKRLMSKYDERFKDINVKDLADEGTYVLIIGESFSRNHSSLFGYPRETSPNMTKRYNEGNLFKFNDVVSPHYFTRDAVLKLITEYAYDSDKKFGESMNIIDLFKKAGYKTFWLSNQEYFEDEGAGLATIISRTDKHEFVTKQRWQMKDYTGKYDSHLFSLLDDVLDDSYKKKFIVIHLYGSHAKYKKRYPKEFSYFNEDAEEDYFSDLQRKNKEIVNEYHNSLRFNDYVVDEIIKKVDKSNKNSFIVYLSDHGEVVFDDNIDFKGHIAPNISMKGVEIPMVVWTSECYRKNNKEKIKRIKSAENKPFASEDLIYPLIDLANLEFDGYKPEKNLFDDKFKEKKRQVSSDGLFYKK